MSSTHIHYQLYGKQKTNISSATLVYCTFEGSYCPQKCRYIMILLCRKRESRHFPRIFRSLQNLFIILEQQLLNYFGQGVPVAVYLHFFWKLLKCKKTPRKVFAKQLLIIYDTFTTHSLKCTVSH